MKRVSGECGQRKLTEHMGTIACEKPWNTIGFFSGDTVCANLPGMIEEICPELEYMVSHHTKEWLEVHREDY